MKKQYNAPQIEDVKLDNLMVDDVLGVATTSAGGYQVMNSVEGD